MAPPALPRARDVAIWIVLLAFWLIRLADGPATTLPPRFLAWSLLAGPAYLSASRERAAMPVVVLWAALIGFCVRWSGHPPDVGLTTTAELVAFGVARAVLPPVPVVITIVALQRSVRGRRVAPRP